MARAARKLSETDNILTLTKIRVKHKDKRHSAPPSGARACAASLLRQRGCGRCQPAGNGTATVAVNFFVLSATAGHRFVTTWHTAGWRHGSYDRAKRPVSLARTAHIARPNGPGGKAKRPVRPTCTTNVTKEYLPEHANEQAGHCSGMRHKSIRRNGGVVFF